MVELDGVFVQIGLSANSSAFREVVETNRPGEIVIDAHCRTNVTGIYAAGDVSTVPYKQIIISMGEGAKAALSAFDDRVRGVICRTGTKNKSYKGIVHALLGFYFFYYL